MALENILSQEIIQKLGWTLLHFVWQAAAVALLLGILLAVLRKSSANLRYIVACAALGLIVLLPMVTMQLVPVSTPQPIASMEMSPAPVIVPMQPTAVETPLARALEYEEPALPESVIPTPAAPWKQRATDLLEPALPYLVLGWLLGVFGLSLWHLGGWAQLQRLRKKMVRQVNESLRTELRRLSQRLEVKRAVQLVESALVQVPTVVGWLRPVILLPASALTGLNSEQLEALLAHELAHIRRHDYLINILQTIVETLGFYHPAVWWVSHKIRVERENCCDDLAVSISGDRVRYARALTSMEEIRGRRGELAVAASGGNLFGRIRRLVGKDSTDSNRASWIPSAITILLIAIIAIPTTLALTANDKTPYSAKFLLDKMLEHRSQVRNLQYVAENNIWRDLAAEQDRIEEQIKSMRESGISERQLEQLKKSLSEAPESRYQILKCTVDDEEHVKIEQTGGTYDSSGKKVPSGDKHIWAWNGMLATNFSQRSRIPASATIKDAPQVATRLGHPWRSFTGIFCKFLEEAIAAEKPVSVEKLKDGTFRIAFDYKTSRYAAIVDPSKGYTCVLQETYNKQGQLTSRSTATYEEVATGIWFPVSGQRQEYTPEGAVRYRSIAKSSQIRINDPDFTKSYFDVDMPEGTAVVDEVQNKQYVVGSKRVYDLKERQKSIAETEEIDPNSWQEKFYSLYRLEDGQVLKRIAPPFIPERRGYLKSIQPGRYSPNTPLHVVSQYFNWDGKLSIRGARVGSGIPRLNTILGSVIGLGNRQYDIPPEILNADMSGDWIVRKDTPQEELLQALERIVKDETSRDIDFVKQKVETEVIIAKGKYNFQLLPNITDGQYVLISTNNTDTYTGGGGGSGTLGKFLRWVGNRVGMNIVDETEAEGVELSWRNHDSSELSRLNHDGEPYNQRLDLLLKNLSRQTGLTFERKTAPVEKWFISENGTIKAPQAAVPEGAMLTLTTTYAENKTQQEKLNEILEKFSNGTSADKSDNNSKSVRESVENYIAAALAGEDEKAAEYAYPESAVAQQTDDTREALQGRNISIVGICIGEWNSLAISSVIQADRGRTGSVVFHLKKVILNQKAHWLIDDIDLETLDTIGKQISYFLNNVPDAKTIIINPNTYANKHTDAMVESDEGRIEGRIIDINTGKGISGVQLAAVPNSSPELSDRFSCTSGENGAFTIGGLQSGEYLLRGDFPSVDVDVISGKCTSDVLIGVNRQEALLPAEQTTTEQREEVQILIGARVLEIPADAMKDVFELSENLSSGLLVRHGHEIAGRLLALTDERKDAKLIENLQMLTLSGAESIVSAGRGLTVKIKSSLASDDTGNRTLGGNDLIHLALSIGQRQSASRSEMNAEGYDSQAVLPGRYFSIEAISKSGEPIIVGHIRPDKPALCLIITQNALVPERQPDSLIGKRLPEPDNIQNIDNLKQAEGKRILVCFWDMNQRPSRNIIVELGKLENELKVKGVSVVPVDTSQEEPAQLKQWLDSSKIPFACGNIEGDAGKVLFRWGVRAQPWLILTDKEGVVRAEGFNIEQLDEKLQEASKLTAAKTRIVHFPGDRAVGDLKVRDARPDEDWDRGNLSQPGWALLGPAQGDVSIPEGEDLRLEVSGDVTDFSFLAELKPNDLQVLLLSNIKISDEDLIHLKGLRGLLALSLNSTPIEGSGFAHLAALTSLKELSLFDTQVSDTGLEHISALKSLKHLNLYVTKIRGPGLKHLHNLTSLVSLDLAATPITDAALVHVAEMTWLKELQLQDTDITDEGLAHLKSLRSLEMLILGYADLKQGYSPITDEGLVHLKGLDSLKYLHLLRTHVTGAGLVHLRNLKALKTIKIAELRLTAKDLEYLEETAGLSDLPQGGEDISEVDVKNMELSLSDRKTSVEAGRVKMRSTAPSGVDKSIVRVDLSVVEVFPDSKMDRETTVLIENILGGKITIPDSPAAADLLRKAAEATAAVKDESAGDKRVTQQQFNTLFDTLVSRGFVKILMRPTLEVVEGQTAQIKTDQNSLEVTANGVKDDIIYLTVKAALSSQSVPQVKEQKPIISTRSFASMVRISSGQSQIIGGMIKPAARPDADGTAKVLQSPARELMCIVTASIIVPAADEVEQSERQHGTEAKEPPADKPVTRVYHIYDLVLVGARISRSTVDGMMDGSVGMMGGHGDMGGSVNISDQAIVNEAQNIVNLIMQTIDPNSWYDNDPNAKGTIIPFPAARPRKLAIYQTLPAHQQIQKLLESRRDQTDTTQISIELRYLYTNVEFLDEVRDSMDIEFTPDTFLDDKQVETLIRASQKKRDMRSLMAPGVTVLNNETARFNTARHIFMSFLDYSEPNNLSQQSPPVPIHTFCRITPHIEDNKNIIIDFVQDIPGLQERIIYDRREMVQSYTETTAITNKRIPNNKTFAFTCDIRKFDQDNQTASPAEKKTLIVLIKPTIIVQEEMPRSEAPAMILNSQRSKGYTAEQADETIYHKPLPEEQPGIGKTQIMIDTKILTASDEFLKYIGLDPNSVASSKGWSDYLVHSSGDSASFVIDQLHADLILLAVAAHKDIQMLVKPQILAMAGKKVEIHILKPDSYILRSPGEPNALSGESESKSNSIELGTTVRLTPNLTPDRKNVELDFEWEYRRLRGFKEHTGPDGNVQKIPIVDTDRIKTPCTVPDGKTLLITGMKIIEQKKTKPKKPRLSDLPLIGGLFNSSTKTGETGNLLILVTLVINPQIKATPILQPLDPNDPLIKQLEENFKRSDEQK